MGERKISKLFRDKLEREREIENYSSLDLLTVAKIQQNFEILSAAIYKWELSFFSPKIRSLM